MSVSEQGRLDGRTLQDAIAEAHEIIAKAEEAHGPTLFPVTMFSGGHDSLVLTHLTRSYLRGRQAGVLHINTGIGIEETREFARAVVHDWNLRLYEFVTPFSYERVVADPLLPGGGGYGFPGPMAHGTMYVRLKQRALESFLRGAKRRGERVMLLAGARVDESDRRMGTGVEHKRTGGQVWVNPLLHFTDVEMHAYREAFDLPRNEVADHLHLSGECLCGSYARPGEKEEIRFFYRPVAERIDRLEAGVRRAMPDLVDAAVARYRRRLAAYDAEPLYKNGKPKKRPRYTPPCPVWGPRGSDEPQSSDAPPGPLCVGCVRAQTLFEASV